MNFITMEQLNRCIYQNIKKIPKDIDLIVGIPRSGSLVANLLALYLNLPYTAIDSYVEKGTLRTGNTRKCEGWVQRVEQAEKVLVVDDSISSGRAVKEAKRLVRKSGMPAEHLYLAVYALENNIHMVDIYFEICHMPRVFEWNYMHSWVLQYCCVDIDGVLCEDPSFFENDDGKRYRKFLLHAQPKLVPTKKIGYIVTARLEKYRRETEAWLKQQGIEYGNLVMMDAASGRERRWQGSHGVYKGEVFRQTGCSMFIESSYEQAVQICQTAGKQVFCTDKNVLITPQGVGKHLKILANDWRFTSKRVVKKLLKKI